VQQASSSLIEPDCRVPHSRTISVVDDDEAVRLATTSLVRSLGWTVRAFASAQEFLDSGSVADTALLISDVRMPGISGIELHERLLAIGFSFPVMFITAFPTAAIEKQAHANGALVILTKPVDAAIIERWIRCVLGDP
jgi:FixJ family two-component response regulator